MSDWKNPENYPSEREAKEASLDLWAWVFLRRNPEFIQELDAAKQDAKNNKADAKNLIGWNETPVGKVLEKWGVEYPVMQDWIDRGLNDSPVIFKRHPVHAHHVKIDGKPYRLMPDSNERVVLEFDLTAPLPDQLKRAKAILKASKEQIGSAAPPDNRKQVAMYPLYLRVLDAIAAKATTQKMAEVFSQERPGAVSEKDINNWIKAAKKLAKDGYASIAKLSK